MDNDNRTCTGTDADTDNGDWTGNGKSNCTGNGYSNIAWIGTVTENCNPRISVNKRWIVLQT